MKTFFTFLSLSFFFLSANSQTYTLDWSSSFAPAWTDGGTSGTATNVGSSGTNVSVAISNSQAGTYQQVTTGINSPAVNTNNGRTGFFIIAGSTDCLEIDVNWTSSTTGFVDVVYTFSKPVFGVQFRVGDIDKNSATSNTYYDQVTITGNNASGSVLPQSITEVNAANYVVISGNSVYANPTNGVGGNATTNSTSTTTQQGTVDVNFGPQALTSLTLRYNNRSGAQADPALQAIAIGNLSFSQIQVSGTVWNDINNSANNSFSNIFTTGETGTNAGGLFVNLVNNAGNVIGTAAVAANGTYSLNAPTNASNLTVRLSTTQGVIGAAAPANSVSTGWTGTSPLQSAAFNTATAAITAKDFGIEQPPQSAITTLAGAGNPGGFNSYSITAGSFQTATGGNPNTADFNGGTVSNMRITSFPTNANSITINGTIYTNGGTCPPSASCTSWPGAGVTVPYTNGTGPTQAISVDPIEGNVTVVLSFAAIDNAGKEDPTPGSVTIPFQTIPLSGLIFNDANGNGTQDGGEALINGTNTGGGLTLGAVLYANLIDASNMVIATTAVQSNGVYSFANVPQSASNLTLQLSTTQGTVGLTKPATTLPSAWGNARENKNGQAGTADGTPNGEITVTAGTVSITLQNFGLDRYPDSAPASYAVSNPAVNQVITLNGSAGAPAALLGSDPEDGTLGSSNTLLITSLDPGNNQIIYNGTVITVGQDGTNPPSAANPFVINNYNPALLQVKATAVGSTGASFAFAFRDAAGLADPTPATYAITWAFPLPLTLLSFDAEIQSATVQLNWSTENQVNFDHFVVERSQEATALFVPLATVSANGQSAGDYTYADLTAPGGVIYYRLKMVDNDGTFTYSKVISVNTTATNATIVYPTVLTAGEDLHIQLQGTGRARLISVQGQLMRSLRLNGNTTVSTQGFKAGYYVLQVEAAGKSESFRIVIK